MVLPKPAVALNDACSVIFDNTLYTYQAGAFQRLPLEQGAKWERLPTGELILYEEEEIEVVKPSRGGARIVKDKRGRMAISVTKNR